MTETIEKIDILSIVDSMLEESTKESSKEGIIDRVKLLHTFYSIGRNLEHADTQFSGMGWDALLNCADIGIRERKTKQHYTLAMTNHCKADTKKYKVCYMHAMALAMVADTDILIRCDDDKNEDFLFSDVQENEASYAGTQLTNMIQKHIKLLHPDISEKNLLEYTVKSPRKGSITFGIIHRDLTLVEVAAAVAAVVAAVVAAAVAARLLVVLDVPAVDAASDDVDEAATSVADDDDGIFF